MPTSGEDIVQGLMSAAQGIKTPLWARMAAIALGVILPAPWKGLAALFPVVVGFIQELHDAIAALPKTDQATARAALSAASLAAMKGNHEPLAALVSAHLEKKQCDGVGCDAQPVSE